MMAPEGSSGATLDATVPDPVLSPAPTADADRRPAAARWAVLVLGTGACVLALEALRVNAALLLGAVVPAVAMAARGATVRVPPRAFLFAQAIVGCMIARTIPPSLWQELGRGWPTFLACVGSVILASAALGWAFARAGLLPGTTAVWGAFPGAATAMVLMAEDFGADVRVVALMQYLRVLMVGFVATAVARLWVHVPAGAPIALLPPSAPLHAAASASTLALALGGAWVGVRARVPAGALLVPMFAGIALQDTGVLAIELPGPLLAASYALVGWTIGLRFTRDIWKPVATLLPRVLASIATLIALCGALAWGLARVLHVDALTAYLAMSPGGADTVAIIASGSPVDVPFVMAMQSARFLLVAACGPMLARLVARTLS
ncbi:MAG: AbrB family transcriptional regulator [Burkholderiaceae bacterium]